MRVPRVRFTVRVLMLAVAIASMVLGVLVERKQRFLQIASDHRDQARLWFALFEGSGGSGGLSYEAAKFGWHMRMQSKYEDAARSPWLPIKPDPVRDRTY